MNSDESNLLAHIEVDENPDLADYSICDSDLGPVRKFRELRADEVPLEPLPPEKLTDIYYHTDHEPRCQICKSPFRTTAERVFLSNGRRPQAVVNFFLRYFNAEVSWEAVAKHMRVHCKLGEVDKSGMREIALREDEMGPYRYREKDMAITALYMQIDAVQGLTATTPDATFKKADMIRRLFESVVKLQKERDEEASNILNPFAIMARIMKELPDEDSKEIVRRIIREIREELNGEK